MNQSITRQVAIWRQCFIAFATFALIGIVEACCAQPWELWTIKADGGGLQKFADTPGYTCGSPDWSPDGTLVAYDTWRVEQTYTDSQIAVIRADSTKLRLIGAGAMPSWSPDGKQLVCHTYDNPQTIVVMNADGSGRETIVNHWGSPRWSPQGNRIASVLNDNIGLYDLATGTERTILPGQYTVRQGFAISPDGLRFCFGDRDGGVAVATLDERSMRASVRWLAKTGTGHHISWSPDGKRVVVGWQPPDAKITQLYVMHVDSNDPPVRIEGQDAVRNNYNPDWSPDGKTIVFASEVPQ